MPKLIPALSAACALALTAYLGLLATAVLFAASQTELAASVREAESRVGALETQYYAQIASLNEIDAASIGLVLPERVEYVALDGTPTVTRASR